MPISGQLRCAVFVPRLDGCRLQMGDQPVHEHDDDDDEPIDCPKAPARIPAKSLAAALLIIGPGAVGSRAVLRL
jgi:hypothetical protein